LRHQDNGVNILTQLGLTVRQAEAYLAIVELEQPTAKSIAQTLQVARSEVYRATLELQKHGLIKKIITTPISFRATPLAEGISILLQQNAEKHKEIRAKAEQILRNYKNNNREKPNQENFQYGLTSGLRAVRREFVRDLAETQTSRDCILEWKIITEAVTNHFEAFKETLERGVKIRYITHILEGEKMPQIIKTLTEMGFFEVKFAPTAQKAGIDVVDKKLVRIITLGSPIGIEVLVSNCPALADLAQDYFELKWQTATTLDSTKR
jgi:sugar-specific transcriptional regulator TrmB